MTTHNSGAENSRPVAWHSLHFDFSHLTHSRDYIFNHSLVSEPLQQHNAATREAARTKMPLLKAIPDQHLTHFIDIELPSDCLALMYVTVAKEIAGKTVQHPIHIALHIPPEGRDKARQLWMERQQVKPAVHPRLSRLGITADDLTAVLDDGDLPSFPAHINSWQDATNAAIALVFQHSNLINLNTDNGGKIPAIIEQHITDAVTDVGDLTMQILSDQDEWMQSQPQPVTGSNNVINALTPSSDVLQAMTGTLQSAIVAVKNDPALEGQQWNLNYSTTTDTYNGTTSGLPGATTAFQRQPLEDTGYSWTAVNKTGMNGLSVDADSISYAPATDAFSAFGLWSFNDTPSLSQDVVNALKAGKLYFQVNTSDYPDGLLSGLLQPGTADPDTGMLPFSCTLAPLSSVSGSSAAGTITASLNPGNTGFSYDITFDGIDGDSVKAFFYSEAGNPLLTVDAINSGCGTLTINVTNKWLRHLSACVQYLDEGGNVLSPKSWSSRVPAFLRHTFEPDSDKPFLALLPPVTTVFGVPIPANATQLNIPVWDEVHSIRLLMGGLGQGGYDSAVCPIGITVTVLAELVLPVFILAAGAAITNSNTVKSLLADPEVLFAVCTAGAFLAAGGGATAIALSQNPGEAAKGMAATFGPMLLSPATSLGKWVAEKISEGASERAAPFVDIALAVINAAVTVAELAQTIIEVLDSPFVFETDISRSMGLQVQLLPDPAFHKFPDHHDYLQVIVTYDNSTTQPYITQSLPAVTLSDPITINFASVPAGGRLKIYAFFYSANGWQSGQGQTFWIPAASNSGNNLVVNGLVITTNKVPLSVNSIYTHQEKTGMVNSVVDWIAAVGTPPTTTVTNMNPDSSAPQQILALGSITIAQEPEMIGYSWLAEGLNIPPDNPSSPKSNDPLWTLQNLSVLQHPSIGYAYPSVGFTGKGGIAYNIASDDNSDTNFFIDPSNSGYDIVNDPSGGYHIRSLQLGYAGPAPVFNCNSNQSYGRFISSLDKYVYHPKGYIVGINFTTHKLYICKLAASAVTDASAGNATLAAGLGDREGLLKGPAGLAVALDGRILVLESLNQRIQAFDVHGSPVAYFPDPANQGQKKSTSALVSRTGSVYLDISVESQGYIYVLSYTGDGSATTDYNIDLYKPDGTFLVTTNNVPAAAITVDILRNLFTLNYEYFTDNEQRPHPSVSLWLPPAPDPGDLGGPEPGGLQHSVTGTFQGKWSFNGQGRLSWNFGNDYGSSNLLLVYQTSTVGNTIPGFVDAVCQINAGSDGLGGPAALPFCSPLPNTQDFYTVGAQAYDQPDATPFAFRLGDPSSFTSFKGPDYAPFGWFISEGWGDFFGWDDSAIQSTPVTLQVNMVVSPADYLRSNLNSTAPQGSDYSFVDLSGCDYSNLSLLAANFNNGDLTGTNFNGSKLTNATFNYGFGFKGATFRGADLGGAQFNNCDLTGVDFSGANLNNASFTSSILTGAIFEAYNGNACTLQQVNFKDCKDVTGCKFVAADLTGARFDSQSIKGCDFTGATLTSITFHNIDMRQASFTLPAAFNATDKTPADLSGSTFDYALIAKQWSFLNLSDVTFVNLPDDLSQLQAQSATLNGLTFSQKNFASVNFQGANLQNCSLSGCDLTYGNFTKAQLQGDNQTRAAILSDANLENADFTQANLSGVNLAGAFFWGHSATMAQAILLNTDFSNAYLVGVNFSGVDQQRCLGCIFDYACLISTNFNGTRAGKSDGSPASFVSACLQGADFTDAQLDGVDLTNAAVSTEKGTFNVTINMGWPMKPQQGEVAILGPTLGITQATTSGSVCPSTAPGPCGPQQLIALNPPKQWPSGGVGEEPHEPGEEQEGQGANWLEEMIRWWIRFWKKVFTV